MDDVLVSRVRRVYAALDSLEEFDMGLLKGHVVESGTFYRVFQDFTGGLDSAQMENLVESGIYNVAHLKDPLKRFAERNEKSLADVEEAINASRSLQLVVDLANVDKHEELRSSRSGTLPRIVNINRVLRMTAPPGAGVGLTLNRDGTPRILGDGTARAVIVADVVDADGAKLGEVDELLDSALTAWELLLQGWGVDISQR